MPPEAGVLDSVSSVSAMLAFLCLCCVLRGLSGQCFWIFTRMIVPRTQ
jgi:hypothetical protein